MATGESLRSLAFSFRISQSYISRIIQVVLKSLSKQLTPILLKSPTKENSIRVAENFWNKWNFPNCVGAIDGNTYEYLLLLLEKVVCYFTITKTIFPLCFLQLLTPIANSYLWILDHMARKEIVEFSTNPL